MIRLRRNRALPVFETPTTTLVCQARHCAGHNAVPCGYRDRRGRLCPGQFCPRHSESVDGVTFCRRHAGTVRALDGAGQLPDVDNRAPSLVHWIANDLDKAVRNLLTSVAHPGERLLFDNAVRVVLDADRRGRWERSWKLIDSAGIVIKVTVEVDERSDPSVRVRVGSEIVAQRVPPWIERHLLQKEIPPEVDQADRQLFYGFLEDSVTAAVHLARTGQPSWV